MNTISCFTDCNSECVIMRIPYTLAVELLQIMPKSQEKSLLYDKMKTASRRSKKFYKLLENVNQEEAEE